MCLHLFRKTLEGSFSVDFKLLTHKRNIPELFFYISDNVNSSIVKTVQLSKRFEFVSNAGEKGGWGIPRFCNEPNKRIQASILIIRSDKFVMRG